MSRWPFQPLTTGKLPELRFQHAQRELGTLRVASGQVRACDPYVNLDEEFDFAIPPGNYRVVVTVADVSDAQDWSHTREAYLSLVLSDAEPVRHEKLAPLGKDPAPAGEFYGIGVDAGMVGFVDSAAVATAMPGDATLWYDEVFDTGEPDSWFRLIYSEDHLFEGAANIVLPLATDGENVILCSSGWGDGFYPVVGSYDAQNNLVALHIDLFVDEFEGETNDEPEAVSTPEAPEAKPKGFFARLFAR